MKTEIIEKNFKQIEAYLEITDSGTQFGHACLIAKEALYEVKILKAILQHQDKWISVKDEMPKEVGYYLVVVDERVASKRQGVVEIQECYESVADQKLVLKFQDYVTHWQPLPSKPKNK